MNATPPVACCPPAGLCAFHFQAHGASRMMATGSRAGTPVGVDKDKSEALARMDLVKISRAYLKTLIDEDSGYKGLLLDKETMKFSSTLFGRQELAEHNVVVVERLDGHDGKDHPELKVTDTGQSINKHDCKAMSLVLQAMVYLRPTRENITQLKRELKNPRYQSYYLCMSQHTNGISMMSHGWHNAA
jgi:hypothetical protein